MTQTNYAQVAAAVYQACNHYDPYLTPLSVDLAKAWGRQFENYGFSVDELLSGVDRIYRDNGSGYRPLPKDICDAARAVRKDSFESAPLDSPERLRYEALCDSKAEPDEPLSVGNATGPNGQTLRELYGGPGGVQRLAASIAKRPEAAPVSENYLQRLAEAQRKASPPQPIADDDESTKEEK